MPAKAYNPTAQPVVIDDDGHTLPGRTHGDVDTTDDRVLTAVATGRLVLTNERTHAAALERAAERDAERQAELAGEQDVPALAGADEVDHGAPDDPAADPATETTAPTTEIKGA